MQLTHVGQLMHVCTCLGQLMHMYCLDQLMLHQELNAP